MIAGTVGAISGRSSTVRYYDPSTGQFLTRDPLVSVTREAYGYVGGSPLNRTDPSGQAWGIPDWVPVVGGGCIAVGTDSYEDSNGDTQTCDNSDNQDWSGNVLAGAGNALTFGQGVDVTANLMGKGDNFTACYGNSDSWAYRGGAVGGAAFGLAFGGGQAWKSLNSGRGIGVGNLARVARHQPHKAMPNLSGGPVRIANWLAEHHAYRVHWHTVWRGTRTPGGM